MNEYNSPIDWDQSVIMEKLGYADPFIETRRPNRTDKLISDALKPVRRETFVVSPPAPQPQAQPNITEFELKFLLFVIAALFICIIVQHSFGPGEKIIYVIQQNPAPS
jgi:hypothetical protein